MDKRKTQKRQSQKSLAAKRRDDSFIAEYVKRKTPALYAEAVGFLNHLREQDPEKRDYTKTHAFLVATTGFSDYRDYYNRTKLNRYKHESTKRKTTTTTTTTTTIVDNMELNVTLLPEPVVKENTVQPLQPICDETYRDLIEEIATDPSLQMVFNDMVTTQDSDMALDPEVDDILKGLTQQTPLEKELDPMGCH